MKIFVVRYLMRSTFEHLSETILHLSSTYDVPFSHANTIHSDHMMGQVISILLCFSMLFISILLSFTLLSLFSFLFNTNLLTFYYMSFHLSVPSILPLFNLSIFYPLIYSLYLHISLFFIPSSILFYTQLHLATIDA